MIRTALGFAGARDPSRRIADAAALGRYQHAAVQLVRSCLLQVGRSKYTHGKYGGAVRSHLPAAGK